MNSYMVITTAEGKFFHWVVRAFSIGNAKAVAAKYTGQASVKAWPAIGRWQSKADALESSGKTILKAR